jgi:hypothetical protein
MDLHDFGCIGFDLAHRNDKGAVDPFEEMGAIAFLCLGLCLAY